MHGSILLFNLVDQDCGSCADGVPKLIEGSRFGTTPKWSDVNLVRKNDASLVRPTIMPPKTRPKSRPKGSHFFSGPCCFGALEKKVVPTWSRSVRRPPSNNLGPTLDQLPDHDGPTPFNHHRPPFNHFVTGGWSRVGR